MAATVSSERRKGKKADWRQLKNARNFPANKGEDEMQKRPKKHCFVRKEFLNCCATFPASQKRGFAVPKYLVRLFNVV